MTDWGDPLSELGPLVAEPWTTLSTPWTPAATRRTETPARTSGTRVAKRVSVMRPADLDLLIHGCRLAVCAALTGVVGAIHPVWAVLPSSALFLAAFAANHDLVHGAVGRSRALRDVLVAIAGALMLTSGHAIRTMHLLHHRRPLANDDVEGETARMPPLAALVAAPAIAVRYRIAALARAGDHDRRWHIAESVANAVTVLAAICAGGALAAHVVVSAVWVLTMPFWAGFVPHRAPPALIAAARRLAFVRSPVILSFAFHADHHARPHVPCRHLAELASS